MLESECEIDIKSKRPLRGRRASTFFNFVSSPRAIVVFSLFGRARCTRDKFFHGGPFPPRDCCAPQCVTRDNLTAWLASDEKREREPARHTTARQRTAAADRKLQMPANETNEKVDVRSERARGES